MEFAEGQPLSYQSRRADALALMAERYLQNPDGAAEATSSTSTADRYQEGTAHETMAKSLATAKAAK